MAGPGEEEATPATTPDGDTGGLPTPAVLPSMSDEQIKAALRTGYLQIADYAASAFTTDTNFVIAPRPGAENEWILGGGSGHGFKHGPALAEYATRVVTGEEEPAEEFGLGPRKHGPSLRTAGTT